MTPATRGSLRLMFDWGCHGVWFDTESGLANVDSAELGVSSGLASAVRSWTARAEATYLPRDPARSGFADPHEEAAWIGEGRSLARCLAQELRCEVLYYNWSTRDLERLVHSGGIRTAKP